MKNKAPVNCTRMAEWLPLYASEDLPAPQSAQVRQHLAHCDSCAAAAAEFADTRAWLCETSAPVFDESFYADLRYGVQQELSRRPARVAWWQVIWCKPMAVAATVLLLTIFSVRLFQTKGVQRPDKMPDIVKAPAPSPTPDAAPLLMPATNVFAQSQKPRVKPRALRFKQDEKETVIAARAVTPTLPMPNEKLDETVAEPVMSRIEMQTADPNIRIIWLTQNTQRATVEPLAR